MADPASLVVAITTLAGVVLLVGDSLFRWLMTLQQSECTSCLGAGRMVFREDAPKPDDDEAREAEKRKAKRKMTLVNKKGVT